MSAIPERPYEIPEQQFLNTVQAAAMIGRSVNTLRIWRHRRRGPKSFLMDGAVMYPVADLTKWLDELLGSDPYYNPANDPTSQVLRPKRNRSGRRVDERGAA
ncbi:AlpA family transcriptional regulator [Streptomyces sp. N35]|uniref:helix-turn-helix transcriptional regulator n=1 Tax=Streptomyces sp. N35 TaxID=2795730 RepID=UPI0018F74E6F|nr:helix-turn-helix domain-containing protein [Streptomyces sp. N35]